METMRSQLPPWFQVDEITSVVEDGSHLWILALRERKHVNGQQKKWYNGIRRRSGRSAALGKECLERWAKMMFPGINLGEWTVEENVKLTEG
jgi:hypothetical protein